MSSVSKRRKEGSRAKIKSMGDHKEFLKRITKTLYYGQLPTLPCLSLPVTEISCDVWSVSQRGRSLRRLHADAAAGIARQACVSPCALVLAILYLERLHTSNPDYLAATPPTELFLVSLMVGNKFLQDDGEDDEVICSEWAASGGIDLKQLKKLEVEFLSAIDWNVYVSNGSFETGLQWLERQVALRQASSRGYFTYSDLAAATATSDGALLGAVARGLGAGWLAAAAAYLASVTTFVALLASALLLARAGSSLPNHTNRPTSPANPVSTSVLTPEVELDTIYPANGTDGLAVADLRLHDAVATDQPLCCTRWLKYQESTNTRRAWFDSVVVYDWRSLEPWWSTTSVLNWLYQSSLINPMQRWLERMSEYGAMVRRLTKLADSNNSRRRTCIPRGETDDVVGPGHGDGSGKTRAQPRCMRQWLDLGKLGTLAAVSDR